MELAQLVKLSKNMYDHFHRRKKIHLTNDEYRLCQSLLAHNIDLRALFRALYIIDHEIKSFGSLSVSRGNQNE